MCFSSSYARRVLGTIIFAFLSLASLQAQKLPVTTGQDEHADWSCRKCYEDGHGHLARGEYQQAIESFLRSVEADPGKDLPAYYLGLSYFRFGRYREALAAYQQASKLAPHDPFPQYEMGKSYFALGDKEGAQRQYQLLKNLDAELAEYLLDFFSQPLPTTQSTKETPEASKPATPKPETEMRGSETIYLAGKMGTNHPTVLYKERAHYTEIARRNKVQGNVLLTAIWSSDGQLTEIKVVRWLPD